VKVALIHDYLNQYGGAERVLEILLDIFPDAPIYTLLYSPERTSAHFQKRVTKTSILDFPFARHHHRLFIPFMPFAVRSLKIGSQYDLIISDSAGYAKGVPNPGRTFHICYCYTPLRYAWELDRYFANPVFKTVFRPVFKYLKHWDFQAAQKPDVLLAVSSFIAQKINKVYSRTARVVYPPVDYGRFYFDADLQPSPVRPTYYLAAGRLLHYKKFALLVESFQRLGLNLWIVGSGPELPTLEKMAAGADNIQFKRFVTDRDLHALYSGAKAFLFPQVEDFGLVAAESLACGTPVIACAQGGALEIIEEGRTGIFFQQQNADSVVDAVRRFEQMNFDRREVSRLGRKFTTEQFRNGILQAMPDHLREKIGI
jgi:glycosyltransferase involved in cell wall biosynthesis